MYLFVMNAVLLRLENTVMTACSLAFRRCARARMRRAASTAHNLMFVFLAWEMVSPLLRFFGLSSGVALLQLEQGLG